MPQHGSNYFAGISPHTPPHPDPGMCGQKAKILFFSEHGTIAYQIK